MFDKLIFYLSIVLTLMLSGCFIEGRVVDETGKGVSGITVILGGDQSRTTTTNSEGIYYFGDLAKRDVIPAGNYFVNPSKSGYSFTPAGIEVTIVSQTLGDLEDICGPRIGVDFTINRFNNVVETSYGTVKGFEDDANTWVWKAIPFAKPPIGDLRWKAPEDPESWGGVLEAAEFCDECFQFSMDGSTLLGNEDCLYLNVWRPQTEEIGLPVYLWIHGGGNSIGSADTYNGAMIASNSNMVVVTIQYRLGPLGWFTHPAFRDDENALDGSGNYATLDIIKALEWVQDNIAAFGGDPDRVTIAGESAGAINVLSLVISPAASGLFHRAISQSGFLVQPAFESLLASSEGNYVLPFSRGDEYANNLIEDLLVMDGASEDQAQNIREGMSNNEIDAYLRSKSPEKFYAVLSATVFFGMIDFPLIFTDGTVIHEDGVHALDDPDNFNQVPIILGTNLEEMKTFLFPFYSLMPAESYQTLTMQESELWKMNGVDSLAQMISPHKTQPGVYAYQFLYGKPHEYYPHLEPFTAWPTDLDGINYAVMLGADHGLDVPFFFGGHSFLFGSLLFREDNRGGYEALTDAMMAYVAQFARTGVPNVDGLPEWTKWSNIDGESKRILFDANADEAVIEMSTD